MVIWNIFGQGYRSKGLCTPGGRKGTFDGRYGGRKGFCVTFDKSNKTAVSGEDFFYTIAGKDTNLCAMSGTGFRKWGDEHDAETNN